MTMPPNRCIIVLICLISLVTFSSNVFGQAEEFPTETAVELPNPPMKNIFYNVLWGSITGGIIMSSWSVLDDSKPKEDRQSVSSLTGNFVVGATYGGVLGWLAGVYLSMQNITFDEGKTRIAFFTPRPPNYDELDSPTTLSLDQVNLMKLEIKF